MARSAQTFLAPDNSVTEGVDAGLTRLLESLSGRDGLHHATFALSSADGARHWAGGSGPVGVGEPAVRPDTPFFIASITKRFIITLVLQAHERGELNLDSPITAYLPGSVTSSLHVRDGVDRAHSITVRHLASHTSGLPDFFERRSGGPSLMKGLRSGMDQSWTFEDAIQIASQQQHPHFDPQDLCAARQRARYSDTGFQLLIRILEHVAGRAFPELVAERIAVPLGLRHTWHSATESPPSAPAPLPLYAKRRRVDVPGVVRSSNDLWSTTGDLMTFERALATGDAFRDPATRLLLTERRNRLRNAPSLHYGLGTMIFRINRLMSPRSGPVTLVGHSGATGTWLFTAVELGVHLVGTVNQTHAQALPFQVMARSLRIWTQ